MNDLKVSCIVPVYNEGPRVLGVLDALISSGVIDEIVVINDGSSDDSESLLAGKAGINFISYQPNRGKSHAVKVGIETARNEYIMMIDSDLIGLTKESFVALMDPIKKGEADFTMSLRKNSLGLYKFFGLDFVSGERVFRKDILEHLEEFDMLPGFGLESYLNKIIIAQKLRLKVVYWPTVISPRKSVKAGFWKGLQGDVGMIRQIVKYLSLVGTLKMYIAMLRLKV